MKLKIHFSHKEELWNSWSHAGGILMGVVVGAIFLYWCFTMHNGWATAGIILRYADVLHRIYHLPRHLRMEQVEGATAQMGSCRHLLAHCRFLLSYHPDCDARTRLLGMEPLYLHLGMRHSRHGDELCQTQGPQ